MCDSRRAQLALEVLCQEILQIICCVSTVCEAAKQASERANELVGQFWPSKTPRQLVGLQDVLCLVVGRATSLAYFVFSHSGGWL